MTVVLTNFIHEWSVRASSPKHTQEGISETSPNLGQPEFLKTTNTHLCSLIKNPTQDSHNLNTNENHELKNFYAQQ